MIQFIGPPKEKGPLPAIFYFTLTAKDSLEVDPYHQPTLVWQKFPLRVFSATLPYHQEYSPKEALQQWALAQQRGEDFLSPFLEKMHHELSHLIHEGVIDPKRVGAAGLSRGSYIATLFAAQNPCVHSILGFAPLTTLRTIAGLEHAPIHEIAPALSDRHLRFYISNRDTRVSTKKCFEFFSHLVETAYEKGIRSPPFELFLTPPAGHHGHGTLPHIFSQGALWLAEDLMEYKE